MSSVGFLSDDDCARVARSAARAAGEDYDQFPPERQLAVRRGVLQCVQALREEGWLLVSPHFGKLI